MSDTPKSLYMQRTGVRQYVARNQDGAEIRIGHGPGLFSPGDLQLFTLLALFCTLISIFGLYSISSSNMEQRRKEIAIRKVMGASAGTIVKMFFMEYLTIALIANLLALPLAWLFMQSWLQQYAYRSHISAWMYIVIVFATITLIIGTVLYQTIQAARTNPAEVIKSE